MKTPTVPTTTYNDALWRGIDQHNVPSMVRAGRAPQLDNLSLESGTLVLRPGKQGVLTTAYGAALEAFTAILNKDGGGTAITEFWFTTGGRLYRLTKGATSATEILLSGGSMTLQSSTTRMLQTAGYVYLVDGVGSLKRVTVGGSYTAEIVSGLTQPGITAFVAALTALPFLSSPGSDLTKWKQDYFTGTLSFVPDANKNFQSGWWTLGGGASAANVLDANGDPCVELDNVGEYGETPVLALPTDTNLAGVPGALTARLILLRFEMAAEDVGGSTTPTETCKVSLIGYSDAGGVTEVYREEFFPDRVGASPALVVTHLFDWRSISANAAYIRLRFEKTADDGGTRGVDINRVKLTVPEGKMQIATDTANALAIRRGSLLLLGDTLYTRGVELEYTFTGAQSLTGTQKLYINLTSLLTVGTRFRMRLYLRSGATREYASGDLLYTGSDSDMRASVDLTTISAALLASFTCIGFQIADDLPIVDGTDPFIPNLAAPIASLGDIVKPGNLTTGRPLYYRLVEVNATPDTVNLLNVIQSDGSLATTEIIPTAAQATSSVTMPARTNAAATYFKLFRFGDSDDGYGRLVCLLSFSQVAFAFGADTDKGALPYYAAPKNPYLKWTAPGVVGNAGGVLVDNTPASFLENAELYQPGREVPPAAPRDLCEWQSRLWLLAGESDLYGSWLLTADQAAGLYFSRRVLSSDPSRAIKGFYTPVGARDNDKAVRILSVDDRLVVLRAVRHPYILIGGSDPDGYELRPVRDTDARGCSAPNAATVFDGAAVYLGPNGLVAFEPISGSARALSSDLDRVLNPGLRAGGTALTAAAYAKSAIWQHGDCLYLAAPVAGGSANSVIYRLYTGENTDERGWTRWLQGNVTGGGAATSVTDTSEHYVAGIDGQVYIYRESVGDKATAAGSVSPIPWTLQTRLYGAYDGGPAEFGTLVFKRKRALRLLLDIETGAENVSLTLAVTGKSGGSSQSYSLPSPGGANQVNARPTYTEGDTLQVTISGSCSLPLRIKELVLHAAIGGDRL